MTVMSQPELQDDDAQYSSKSNVSSHVDEDTSSLGLSTSSKGVLPAIPRTFVKERNYLVGNMTKFLSSQGSEEFNRYFPDSRLHLYIGTWNMQKCKIPENIDDFLLPEEEEFLQEIYVIGVQEATPDQKEWEIKLQETLGPNHVLLHSASHGVLHLAVFVRRDLVWFFSYLENDKITTRIISLIKTKGAIATSFRLFGTSFLFVTAHFHSGEGNVRERIDDYQKICERLQLPQHSTYSNFHDCNKDPTDRFDCVFWFGDLNFRISQPHQHMKREVEDPTTYNIHEALKCDQLNGCIRRGQAFCGFEEAPIKFMPTYKFNLNSDEYDSSQKLRVPSYTDRILYKSKLSGVIRCNKYNSVATIKTSDHRPVYSLYDVLLKPGNVRSPLSGGVFDQDVYIVAARRRAHYMKSPRSTVCNLL